jgi:hypothetical protein
LEAKVSESAAGPSSMFAASGVAWVAGSGVAAGVGLAAEAAGAGAGAEAEANGFVGALPAVFVEKGFEKGFVGVGVRAPLDTPNSDCPISGWGCSSCWTLGFSPFACVLLPAPFAMRTPRSARTLPSFRRHVFLRHVQMYNRRSCPGKCWGRLPSSCRSRLSKPLQTLHLAIAPEGAVFSSSHDYAISSVPGMHLVGRMPTPYRCTSQVRYSVSGCILGRVT